MRRTAVAQAISAIDAMDTPHGAGQVAQKAAKNGTSISDAKRAIRRKSQVTGSISCVEDPEPGETGISRVLIVSADGVDIRVPLGRNRSVNLINQLVAGLV